MSCVRLLKEINLSNKKIVLTGITTSGVPHIGNLVGAVLPAIQSSKETDISSFLFLADYHSLIKNQDPDLTYTSSFEVAACWLACGLDPEKVIFYRQSDVPHIMELAWVLSCLTSKGLLNRAHAYKAATSVNQEQDVADVDKGVTMGLFNYPILMSADILMFNADEVPVGQDQKQHIEMARDIASRFNHHYGDIFTLPEAKISDSGGVLPGTDGRKMSKSYGNVIPVFCEFNKIKKLVRKIKTNSLEPGVPKDADECTIFSIYQAFASQSDVDDMKKLYENGISWGDAKDKLAELIDETIRPYRVEYQKLCEDRKYVGDILKQGAKKASEVAEPMLEKVRRAVGIREF